MVFLHSHGVGTARAVRIFKTYGSDAIQVMSENPYRLARDIRLTTLLMRTPARRNIWSGDFEMPWDRSAQRQRTNDMAIAMKPQPEPSAQEVLAGLVERVTYHNAENGFCVRVPRHEATAMS